MDRWIWYAIFSMAFAGLTSVFAKQGLANISGELGLFIRTVFVVVFVFLFATFALKQSDFATVSSTNLWWLGFSAATTAASWVFYYKALKDGDVSTVALIDKGSVVVALALAFLFLGETFTLRKALGCGLILAGVYIVARK